MNALTLKVPDSRRRELSWLVKELQRQAGDHSPLRVELAPGPSLWRGERCLLEEAELSRMFAVLSLSAELELPRDHFGRPDQSAPIHDISTPWLRARAREVLGAGEGVPPLTVFLTHDVDRTTGLELTSLVKAARGTLSGNRRHWLGLGQALDHGLMPRRLRRLLEIEQRHGVRGVYFMIAGPAGLGRYDSRTDIHWRSARHAVEAIRAAGGVIGLHGGFHVAERDGYLEEAERIRRATGLAVRCQRNHYLRLDIHRHCQQLEAAGLAMDFTLGYSRRTGFRNGVCGPFRLWDLANGRPGRITAIPLVYMEQAGTQLDPGPAMRDLEERLKAAAACGGAISLLIHPEVFAVDERWYEVYETIIALCRSVGARLDADPEELMLSVEEGEPDGD
ncbi:MAG: hypothetical protein H6678_01590 [Candidatus Delongbacteria bacterium]|nr:hypothetical protein [Candidatus Delongbacteria bacterium]